MTLTSHSLHTAADTWPFLRLWRLIEVLGFTVSFSNVNTLARCRGISVGRRRERGVAQIAKAQNFCEDCACWKPRNPRAQICAEESSCATAMKYSFDHKAGVLPCLTFLSKLFHERPPRVGPAHTVTAVSNNLLSYSPTER